MEALDYESQLICILLLVLLLTSRVTPSKSVHILFPRK